MSKKYEESGSGIGFFGFLTLMFIAFKLLGIINWSWWWVLSPIWIPVLIGLVIWLVFSE
ncbi:hypothetical protein IKF63_01170 [Candidatus Saccharibacteria bacterium]|nr:hypothetical protein [Candidatus Saccharibacteria bacterium]MBR3180674.1 hypothetical protein [Candidatus Saccharibacteria bacterium]